MAQTASLTPDIQKKFADLAAYLGQASRLAKEISQGVTTPEEEAFWRNCDELKEAFADLNEQELTDLVGNAVQWARQHPTL